MLGLSHTYNRREHDLLVNGKNNLDFIFCSPFYGIVIQTAYRLFLKRLQFVSLDSLHTPRTFLRLVLRKT